MGSSFISVAIYKTTERPQLREHLDSGRSGEAEEVAAAQLLSSSEKAELKEYQGMLRTASPLIDHGNCFFWRA